MAAKRGKVVRTIDDARGVLKEIVGPYGSVQITQTIGESFEPGSRYESVDWSGAVVVKFVGDRPLLPVTATANTPAELVRRLAQQIRLRLEERANDRQPRRIDVTSRPGRRTNVLATSAVRKIEQRPEARRLEHQPAAE